MADMAVASKCNNCLGLLESNPNTNLEHLGTLLFRLFFILGVKYGKLCPSLRTIADELDLFRLALWEGLRTLRIIRITRLVKIARLARILRFVMALRTLLLC